MKYLIIDSREKPKATKKIISYFDKIGVEHVSSKLLFGDYMDFNNPGVVVDRKQNIAELAKNCTWEHERFKSELARAKMAGSTLVVLVEQDHYRDRGNLVEVKTIEDLMLWTSPYTTICGEKVFRVLSSWCSKYPLRVEFCNKNDTGKRILEIIYGKHNA